MGSQQTWMWPQTMMPVASPWSSPGTSLSPALSSGLGRPLPVTKSINEPLNKSLKIFLLSHYPFQGPSPSQVVRQYPPGASLMSGWLLATPPSPAWSRPTLTAVMSVLVAQLRPLLPLQLQQQPQQPPPHPALGYVLWCPPLSQPPQWIRLEFEW